MIEGSSLRAMADGFQEIPVPPATQAGDLDGFASAFVRAAGDRLRYSLTWTGITAPTLGHIHEGKTGVNGPVRIGLFGSAVPAGVFAVSGQVADADPAVVRTVTSTPSQFYVNLHTAEFKDGAARGQLFR
jgi:hypothetical protein